MSLLARFVIPGVPHHVTQRGNRRERAFLEEGDYALYLDLLDNAAERAQAEIWSYCLMPDHVHITIVPSNEDGRWRASRRVHRDYTGVVNTRTRVTGHLWQGRYGYVAMDEPHFANALRYVALIPARARLAERPED